MAHLLIITFLFLVSLEAYDSAGEVLRNIEKDTKLAEPKPKVKKNPEINLEPVKRMKDPGDGIKFYVSKFKFKNITLLKASTLKKIVEPHVDKKLTFAQLQNITYEITNEYRKNGFIAAYAYLPEQDVVNGVVTIEGVEAILGEVDIRGNQAYSKEYIRKYFDSMYGLVITEQNLEDTLNRLNTNPMLSASASLKEGKYPRQTDIILSAQEGKMFYGNTVIDNFGSKYTSEYRSMVNLNNINSFINGDRLSGTFLTGLDRLDLDRLFYGSASYELPLSTTGYRIGGFYTYNKYELGGIYEPLEYKGKSNTYGINLTKDYFNWNFLLGLHFKDFIDYMLDETRTKDRIRLVKLNFNKNFQTALGGNYYVDIGFKKGLSSFAGGSSSDQEKSSRFEVDADFIVLTYYAQRLQNLTDKINLLLKINGQYTDNNLYSSEQFSIGGANSVRGYQSSVFSGDKGNVVNAELHYEIPNIYNSNAGLDIALFYDWGWAKKNHILPGEEKEDDIQSLGLMISANYENIFNLKLQWGVPKIDSRFKISESVTHMQAIWNF